MGDAWLDAARYADSDGFEKDKLRYVWLPRLGINALNKDMPYDEFVIETIGRRRTSEMRRRIKSSRRFSAELDD